MERLTHRKKVIGQSNCLNVYLEEERIVETKGVYEKNGKKVAIGEIVTINGKDQ